MQLQFVRFGGLSSVPQKGYDPTMPGFHSPPARRGIYAFVEKAVSYFLLGQDHFDSRRAVWVRDAEGGKIPWDSDEACRLGQKGDSCLYFARKASDGESYLARHKPHKTFTYVGDLWHHLPVSRSEVLYEKGTWVKTSAEAHRRAYLRELHKCVYQHRRGLPARLFDEFEVFIEKV